MGRSFTDATDIFKCPMMLNSNTASNAEDQSWFPNQLCLVLVWFLFCFCLGSVWFWFCFGLVLLCFGLFWSFGLFWLGLVLVGLFVCLFLFVLVWFGFGFGFGWVWGVVFGLVLFLFFPVCVFLSKVFIQRPGCEEMMKRTAVSFYGL